MQNDARTPVGEWGNNGGEPGEFVPQPFLFTENALCGELRSRCQHPILASMVSLCIDSLKHDIGDDREFAKRFAEEYGADLQRLEKAILDELGEDQ